MNVVVGGILQIPLTTGKKNLIKMLPIKVIERLVHFLVDQKEISALLISLCPSVMESSKFNQNKSK